MVESPLAINDVQGITLGCESGDVPCVESYYRTALHAGSYIIMLAGLAVLYGMCGDGGEFLSGLGLDW